MRFELIDAVLERSDNRIVAVKNVVAAEEYLQDHFPSFPILPGVFMLEAMVQAARRLIESRTDADPNTRYVLGAVRGLKYGAMVRPGESLTVDVTVAPIDSDGAFDCKGSGAVSPTASDESPLSTPPRTAVSGRFTLRPLRSS